MKSHPHTITTAVEHATTAEWEHAADALSRALESIEALVAKTRAVARSGPRTDTEARWLGRWVKLESQSERIASSLAVLGCACFEIKSLDGDDEVVAEAWKLFEYFKRRTRSLLTPGDSSLKDRHISRAVDWIRRQPANENGEIVVSTRDVQSYRVANVGSASDARRLFRQLARRGHGVVRPGRRGKSLVFVLSDTPCNIQHSQRSP